MNTVLASGLNSPQDLVLDPSGTTLLVSDTGNKKIDRVTLANTPTVVNTVTEPSFPIGMAYDGAGHLFASIGGQVYQINPYTGAILKTGPALNADGLTYDAGTSKLYATDDAGANGFLYSLDPATLRATQLVNSLISNPDRITSDGGGNPYIAERGDFHIDQYNLNSQQLTQQAFLSTVDDLAPASGLGFPQLATPEPSTFLLAAIGTVLTSFRLFWGARRKCRAVLM
jgi:sugar lactone lactonase YvrE